MDCFISRFLPVLMACPAIIGCSSVIGPHRISFIHGNGVEVVQLTGYGINSIQQNDTAAIHLGWSHRTFVFESADTEVEGNTVPQFRFYSRLPRPASLHQSVVDAGLCAAWEPTFRGISLGYQSRLVTRLPLYRSLIFEAHISPDHQRSTFSLQQLP